MPPRVLADLPGTLADLYAWGRTDGGEWWALIAWTEQETRRTGGHVPILRSAWVPAAGVHQSAYPRPHTYQGVVWLALPTDSSTWPALHVRTGHRYGHLGRVTAQVVRNRSHGSAYG
ncbi:hypothetical protein [uncultured Jatrophihabitans sp.]|uniref:hypothetical protein n=1 Tax=uncultured Jatrophihabitans sp. TaxID=1610747 RepID=UPI0035C9AEDB